jgi:hypothetical protein
MSEHESIIDTLPLDGEKVDVSKFEKIIRILAVVGGLGILISLIILAFTGGQKPMAYSWLWAFYFYVTLALGGLFWVLLHNASNSGWGVVVRRVMEHVAGMLPYMFLFAIPLVFFPGVREALYEWMVMVKDKEHLDPVIAAKQPYLSMPFFYLRMFLYAGILSTIVLCLRHYSIGQDRSGALRPTFSARRFSCGTIPLFALCLTFMAVDLIMGLDYAWYSTMWGVQIFAGSALSSMALIILTVTFLRKHGYLKNIVSTEHYHIMGKLMFAFVVFWAYISFSQFFLYWYANITEETKFFILRNTDGWYYVSVFLVLGHFGIPFLFLLRQQAKKDLRQICAICFWILFVHMVDLYWLIVPERGPSLTHGEQLMYGGTFFYDLLAIVTIGATIGFIFLRTIGKHSIYPCRDPRLQESIDLRN